MKRSLLIAGSTALAACSPATWQPLRATDAATELSQITRSSANELDPAISPDARSLAYEVAASLDAPPHVEVMSLAGAGPGRPGTVVYSSGDVSGREPAWMPDGTGLFFLSAAPHAPKLRQVVGLGSNNPLLVADVSEVGFAGEWPAMSPDGSSLAMSMTNTEVFHSGWPAARHFDHALGIAGPPGSGFEVFGEGTEPAWSPHGKRLVFVRAAGGRAHLFVASADGTGAQQITQGPSDDEEPSWSPDGTRLVFCSANVAVRSKQADLFSVRPDGSGLVQLTEGVRDACHPTWGRDGFVYFHVNAGERYHVWRLRPR